MLNFFNATVTLNHDFELNEVPNLSFAVRTALIINLGILLINSCQSCKHDQV